MSSLPSRRDDLDETIRRFLDLVIALAVLMLTAPLLLFCSAAVKLSGPGPVFFRQKRLGKDGRPFDILKFRSMLVDSNEIRNADGSTFVSAADPRVTRVGRLLRRTSLDELPQLFNVVRGEMCLVGPRPDQVDQLRYYSETDKRKLKVKPGITGLAQISGRNNIPWERRKRLDVEYVNRQSFWLDLKILTKTIPYVLLRRDVNANVDCPSHRAIR